MRNKSIKIAALLRAYQDNGVFNGAALISENSKVIFKKGFGFADFEWRIQNTPDTKFRLGSITKQFTAVLVLQLVEEHKLSLNTKLTNMLPYYRKDTGDRITVHQLLTHTSGIPSYTSLPNFFQDVSRNPYAVREFIEKYCSGDLEFEPGTKFMYDNSGYFLLGAIIEQVAGRPYSEVLHERIFDPLGMKASGYDLSQPILEKRAHGYEQGLDGVRNADYLDMLLPYAAGALYSTVEDLYLWDQALYSRKLLTLRSKARMFKANLQNYGYGWGIQKMPIGPNKAERLIFGHGGGINGFNTLITRIPEDHNLVVLLNNTGRTNLGAMQEGITDILYGRSPAPAKHPVASVLYQTFRKSGITATVALYQEIKTTRAAEYDLSEGQLDCLGTELLNQKQTADSIIIFKLNVETFPADATVHNSLANAYQEAGEIELATKSYAKVLELDPANRNALDKLNGLAK